MNRFLPCIFFLLILTPALFAKSGKASLLTENNASSFLHKFSTSSGGRLLIWEKASSAEDFNPQIFAQQINKDGELMWGKDVELTSGKGTSQTEHKIVSDNFGGVILAWEERTIINEESHVYIQRIDSLGNKLWGDKGILVVKTPGSQITPHIIPDLSGGAIVAWSDCRNDLTGANWDIYMQRINSGGEPLWAADGVMISTDVKDEFIGKLVPGMDGGATIVWNMVVPGVAGTAQGFEFHFRKLNSEGSWNPTLMSSKFLSLPASETNYELADDIFNDGENGFAIALIAGKNHTDAKLHIQYVNPGGEMAFAYDGGLRIDTLGSDWEDIQLSTDSIGNFLLSWTQLSDSTTLVTTHKIANHGTMTLVDSKIEPIDSLQTTHLSYIPVSRPDSIQKQSGTRNSTPSDVPIRKKVQSEIDIKSGTITWNDRVPPDLTKKQADENFPAREESFTCLYIPLSGSARLLNVEMPLAVSTTSHDKPNFDEYSSIYKSASVYHPACAENTRFSAQLHYEISASSGAVCPNSLLALTSADPITWCMS